MYILTEIVCYIIFSAVGYFTYGNTICIWYWGVETRQIIHFRKSEVTKAGIFI